MANLLTDLPDAATEEVFTSLIDRPGVRIERIVSMGQTTSADTPYDQPHDEWVLLLAGEARLWIERQGERLLMPGDAVLIGAHIKHRVTWTSMNPPTVWLAIHFVNG